VLEADREVGRLLDAATLDTLFDPQRFLVNLGGVFDKLEKLPLEPAPEPRRESAAESGMESAMESEA
jgi:hypothetical protein